MDQGAPTVRIAELVQQHYASLYRFALRLSGSAADAEDLTQETFLTAHTRLSQLRQPENAKSWLFTILRNRWLQSVRGPRLNLMPALEEYPDSTDDCSLEADVDPQHLQRLLDELPEDFRVVVVLFYFGEFSYKEIAAQLSIPIGTVMSRLARAKSFLRRQLTLVAAGTALDEFHS